MNSSNPLNQARPQRIHLNFHFTGRIWRTHKLIYKKRPNWVCQLHLALGREPSRHQLCGKFINLGLDQVQPLVVDITLNQALYKPIMVCVHSVADSTVLHGGKDFSLLD